MEARNKAIASKSRNSSPAPPANGRTHRRDRSSDPPTTRFPIHTNSASIGEAPPRRGAVRVSLEVPSDEGSSPQVEKQTKQNSISHMISNLNNTSKPLSETISQPSDSSNDANHKTTEGNDGSTFAEKRESLGRSSRFPPRKQGTLGSLGAGNVNGLDSEHVVEDGERHGVQLSDKPMDD